MSTFPRFGQEWIRTLPAQGMNTQMWMQLLQKYVQGTEEIPATDVQERLQSDPAFKARIEKMVKQIKFAEDQMENARIGKIGTKPGIAG